MPRQVFSVFATPHFLSRVSSIIIGLCGPGFSMIPRSDQLSFVSWSLVWMQQNFSLNLRVHFKVKFIAPHHPEPFSEFISKNILERVANGSLSVWGKVGEVSPPHLVIPSPWILLLTSPVTSITILSKPRAMTKVGMTMSAFRQTVGHTSVFSGMDGTLFLILSPLDGRLARTFIILSV